MGDDEADTWEPIEGLRDHQVGNRAGGIEGELEQRRLQRRDR
jgi:hypothetical protein